MEKIYKLSEKNYKIGDTVELINGKIYTIKTVWKGIIADEGKIEYEMEELSDIYFLPKQIKCKLN